MWILYPAGITSAVLYSNKQTRISTRCGLMIRINDNITSSRLTTVVPLLQGHPWVMGNLALLEEWRLVRGISDTSIHGLFSGNVAL